jgi:cell division protein FtsL
MVRSTRTARRKIALVIARRCSERTMREREVGAVRMLAGVLVVVACVLTTVGVIRVSRRHEVLALGYRLSHESERVQKLREVKRRLDLELATLTTPERIRKLAGELGMTQVAPDHIRVVDFPPRKKVASR